MEENVTVVADEAVEEIEEVKHAAEEKTVTAPVKVTPDKNIPIKV